MTKDMRFEYTYIYGAVCPERDIGAAIVINHVSKVCMEKHLEIISKSVLLENHAVLIMDRAPWHRSLKVPANISIISLPAYSPELNPQENIWEYLKNNYLSNKIFESAENLLDACCSAWNSLSQEAGRIRSIASRDWATLD